MVRIFIVFYPDAWRVPDRHVGYVDVEYDLASVVMLPHSTFVNFARFPTQFDTLTCVHSHHRTYFPGQTSVQHENFKVSSQNDECKAIFILLTQKAVKMNLEDSNCFIIVLSFVFTVKI